MPIVSAHFRSLRESLGSHGSHRIPLGMGTEILMGMRMGMNVAGMKLAFHNGIPITITLLPILSSYAERILRRHTHLLLTTCCSYTAILSKH